MAFFSREIFNDSYEYGPLDGVGPEAPPVIEIRGIPLNAYKQFKFIDRDGNTYHLRREEGFPSGY